MKRLWMLWALVSVCVLAAAVSQAAGGTCGAWVDGNGTVHIPEVNVNGAIYWATLQLQPSNNGAIMLTATDYGPVAESHCDNSQRTFYLESEGDWRAFIPMVEYAGGAYWAMLELVPSTDGLLWFKVTGYGNGGDWSGEGGAFLATMKVDVVSASDLQMKIRGRSPLGLEAEITTTLLPHQPASPPSFTHAQPAEDTWTFRLTYTVPSSDLPPEVVGRLRATSALNATSETADDSQVGVVIEVVQQETVKNVAEQIAAQTYGQIAAGVVGPGGTLLDVFNAWRISETSRKIVLAELDALEKCAKGGSISQHDLEELVRIRGEVKMNTARRYVMMMTSVANSAMPDVAVVVASHADYTDKIADALDDAYLDQVRKMAPCKPTWSGTFTADFRLVRGADENDDDCAVLDIDVSGEAAFELDPSATPPDPGYTTVWPLKSGSMTATFTWTSSCSEVTVTGSPPSRTAVLVPGELTMEVSPSGHAQIATHSGDHQSMEVTEIVCVQGGEGGGCKTVSWDAAGFIILAMMSEGDAVPPDLNQIMMTKTEPYNGALGWENRWLLTRSPSIEPRP